MPQILNNLLPVLHDSFYFLIEIENHGHKEIDIVDAKVAKVIKHGDDFVYADILVYRSPSKIYQTRVNLSMDQYNQTWSRSYFDFGYALLAVIDA
jgi:hypothetical protein